MSGVHQFNFCLALSLIASLIASLTWFTKNLKTLRTGKHWNNIDILLHLSVIKLQRSFFKHSYDIAVNICICAIKYKIVNNLITSLSFSLLKKLHKYFQKTRQNTSSGNGVAFRCCGKGGTNDYHTFKSISKMLFWTDTVIRLQAIKSK